MVDMSMCWLANVGSTLFKDAPGTDDLAITRALLELICSSGVRFSEAVGLDLDDLEREVRVTDKGKKRIPNPPSRRARMR